MSLLAPLYLLGLVSLAAPVFFHLWQKRPRREIEFSTLMFLQPSPPRVTRRSRLNQVTLMLLRAAVFVMLALAFSRPFLRSFAAITSSSPGRTVLILLDQSASMRRGDLWSQAERAIDALLAGLGPNDRVGFAAFDEQLYVLVNVPSTAPAIDQQTQEVREHFRSVKPTWRATHLGTALSGAVEALNSQTQNQSTSTRTIVVISDFQSGASLDGLEGRTWPDVVVDPRVLNSPTAKNVSAEVMPSNGAEQSRQTILRLTNHDPQAAVTVGVNWHNGAGQAIGATHRVQVPAQRSRHLALEQPADAVKLVLQGDAEPFDNRTYVTPRTSRERELWVLSPAEGKSSDLTYFLQQAELTLGNTQFRPAVKDSAHIEPIPAATSMVVVTSSLGTAWIAPLREYLQVGGRILIVIDPVTSTWDAAAVHDLAQLSGLPTVNLEPRKHDPYAMLAHIDFRHPLFTPFADPKFSDFTKLRIWSSARLTTPDESQWNAIVQYDDGSPFLLEVPQTKGHLWMITTSWLPESSQLAVSTKFVPLLLQMIGVQANWDRLDQRLHVGDTIDLSQRPSVRVITTPDGQTRTLAEQAVRFDDTTQVGLYTLSGSGPAETLAVNLSPAESRVSVMELNELERRGLTLGKYELASVIAERERQMKDVELEARQQGWRWFILTALLAVAVESWLASRADSTVASFVVPDGRGNRHAI